MTTSRACLRPQCVSCRLPAQGRLMALQERTRIVACVPNVHARRRCTAFAALSYPDESISGVARQPLKRGWVVHAAQFGYIS